MRQQFHGYFRPTEKEFEELWRSALITLDTNVLLNFYRYSEATRHEFLKVLTSKKEKLWLPYRVGAEFFRNRLNVLTQQAKSYQEAAKAIDQLTTTFENKRQHPFISQPLLEKLLTLSSQIKKELEAGQQAHETQISQDPVLNELELLFHDRIGPAVGPEEETKLCNQAKERYKKKIPPGFKDYNKDTADDSTRPFSDFLIWTELMNKARAEKRAVILIQDDQKEDWWLKHGGKTISPLPELLHEFRSQTGQAFYAYHPESFLRYASKYTAQKVSAPAIDELKEMRKAAMEAAVREMSLPESLIAPLGFTNSAAFLSYFLQLFQEYTAARAEFQALDDKEFSPENIEKKLSLELTLQDCRDKFNQARKQLTKVLELASDTEKADIIRRLHFFTSNLP